MITKKVIDELYARYRKPPHGIENLDIGLLFEYASDHHNITIDENGSLVIKSIDSRSPFHKFPLANIHGLTHFEDVVAIVLHSSIIFLNKHDHGVNVHLQLEGPTLWERMKLKLGMN
ncbi:hypothetical protein [uncultured Muribaculum sp.]|uniref:hypothetical protein n=1 Tax=uncultured Muribaculum sp. TaxID=1918613 RepID=UPI00259354E3|nr:hypothetical protein [uncultured Muribaculum sp.]